MADTESLRQVAHARAPWSVWFGIVLLFALFGLIVLAIIGPSQRSSDYEEARAKKRVENLKTLREEADKTLTTYGWVDKNKAFVFVDPTISSQSFVCFLAQRLQILHTLFCPGFFVIAATLRRANDCEHDQTKKGKEKHDPKPHGPWSTRMGNLTKRFRIRHISSPGSKIRSVVDRGPETEKSSEEVANKRRR